MRTFPCPARNTQANLVIALALTSLLALPATGALAATDHRLDHNVVPTFESLRLQLDPALADYSGNVHIDLTVAAATDSMLLFAKDLTVRRVTLRGATGEVGVKHEGRSNGRLLIRSARPLAPGAYGLDIEFDNDFDSRANGLYRLQTGGDWYCFTQFEAVAAREAFPCWDEPEFKIPFQVTVTVPEKDEAVSNTPVETSMVSGGHRTFTFKRTPPLPSYLLAIATGPLEFVPIKGMSIPGRVVTVKGATRLATEAARLAPPIIAALEKYFGRPYPYAKLDLLAVPEFDAGAMENAGAVMFRDNILLVDPAMASPGQRYRLIAITAHELAHMWFGNLVTMAWWDDVWLNESFASWMGSKVTQQVAPQFETPVRDLSGTQRAMQTDARLSTRAIRKSVDAFDNMDQMFDELAYQKGQAVLEMLEQWLGPETFRSGVLDYLKAHEWKNATAADLWRSLSTVSGKDISATTKTFLDQEGVPLVTLEPLAGGKVRLRQQRFLNYGVVPPRPSRWRIPVTLRYSDGKRTFTQSVLLADPALMLTLEKTSTPAWVLPNAGERGYFRWSMPAPMLDALSAAAPRALDARERVGLLGNVAALLDAGLVHGDEYVRTLERFKDDPQPEVVSGVLEGVSKVHDFVTPTLENAFALWTRELLRPAFQRFGTIRKKGESESVSLTRSELLSQLGAYGNDPAVNAWAGATTLTYLNHPESVDAAVAGTALGLAARSGDEALYEAYRTRFETATVPDQRNRYLGALGGFRKADLVEKALAYSLSGPLRPQELFVIPRGLAETDALKLRCWEWFKTNYDVIVKRVPAFYVPNLSYFAACCEERRIEDARVFFNMPAHAPVGTKEVLAKVLDGIGDCAGLRQREGAAVARVMMQVAQAP